MKRLHSLRALCCASLFALLPNVVHAQIQLPATSCEPADLPVLSTESTLLCAGSATTIQITSGTLTMPSNGFGVWAVVMEL